VGIFRGDRPCSLRALPPDSHDDARCHAWRLASALGRGSRIGAAPSAWHYRSWRTIRVPNSNAVYHASHLSDVLALRFLAQQATRMNRGAMANELTISTERTPSRHDRFSASVRVRK